LFHEQSLAVGANLVRAAADLAAAGGLALLASEGEAVAGRDSQQQNDSKDLHQ
jgi:hypothetical protein